MSRSVTDFGEFPLRDISQYLDGARLKEITESRLFLRLDRRYAERRKRAKRLDAEVDLSQGTPYRGGPLYLVGPELSGSEAQATSLALHFLERGCEVHLVTRLSLDDLVRRVFPKAGKAADKILRDSHGAVVDFVKPRERYSDKIGDGKVVSFYLPMSAGLAMRGIKHMVVLGDGGLPTEDADLLSYIPDFVAGPAGQIVYRRVFPADADSVARLLFVGTPPLPLSPHIPTVSACLIARDEEGMIEDCLTSLTGCADEVVVNDTGSTDRTPEIARSLGAVVLQTTWNNDFAAARNASIDAAHGDYILVIDADERVTPDTAAYLKEDLLKGADGYIVPIANEVQNGESIVTGILRLFRNSPHRRYKGAIHEQIAHSVRGPFAESRTTLRHLGYLPSLVAAKSKRRRNAAILSDLDCDEEMALYYKYQTGMEFKLSEDFPQAAQIFTEVYEAVPKRRESFAPYVALYACESLLIIGKTDQALKVCLSALEDFPGFSLLAMKVAQGLLEAGRHSQAYDLLVRCPPGLKAARALPNLADAERAYGLTLAKALLGMGRREDALASIASSLDADPNWAPAQSFLVGNFPDRAREVLAARSPKSVRGAVAALIRAGRNDEALALARLFSDEGASGDALIAAKRFQEGAERLTVSKDRWDRQRAACLCLAGHARLPSEVLEGIIGIHAAGVKHCLSGFVLDPDLHPRAPRRISRRKFMPRLVEQANGNSGRIARSLPWVEAQIQRFLLEHTQRSA